MKSNPHRITTVLCLELFLLLSIHFAAFASSGNSTDSLRYEQVRNELLERDSSASLDFIEAADEFARLGMYDRALSVLASLVESSDEAVPGTKTDTGDTQGTRWCRPSLHLTIGGEYRDFNDIDTGRNQSELLDPKSLDLKEIYCFARQQWEFKDTPARFLSAKTRISSNDASVGGELRADFFKRRLLTEADIEVKKQFWHESFEVPASGNALFVVDREFAGFHPDPSDMVRGRLSVAPGNKNSGQSFEASFPVTVDAVWYRENRFLYTSYMDAVLQPRLTRETRDMSKTISTELYCRYRNFSDSEASFSSSHYTADRLLLQPQVRAEIQLNKLTGELDALYSFEHYAGFDSLKNWHEVDFRGRCAVQPVSWCEPGVWFHYFFERQNRSIHYTYQIQTGTDPISGQPIRHDRDTTADYAIEGHTFQVEPFLSLKPNSWFSSDVRFRWERTGYPVMLEPVIDYLSESIQIFEPGISCTFLLPHLNASFHGGYRHETSLEPGRYFYDTRKTIRVGGRLNADLGKRFAVFGFGEQEWSSYDEKAGMQTNTSLSGGITVKL